MSLEDTEQVPEVILAYLLLDSISLAALSLRLNLDPHLRRSSITVLALLSDSDSALQIPQLLQYALTGIVYLLDLILILVVECLMFCLENPPGSIGTAEVFLELAVDLYKFLGDSLVVLVRLFDFELHIVVASLLEVAQVAHVGCQTRVQLRSLLAGRCQTLAQVLERVSLHCVVKIWIRVSRDGFQPFLKVRFTLYGGVVHVERCHSVWNS